MRPARPIGTPAAILAVLVTLSSAAFATGDDRAPPAVPRAVEADDLTTTNAPGAVRAGLVFRVVPPKGWLLIGFDIMVAPSPAGDVVFALKPLFLTATGDQIYGDEVSV